MSKPRVLLADDHTLVLDGFRKLLEEDCEIVGAVEDGRALLEAAEQHKPERHYPGYLDAAAQRH